MVQITKSAPKYATTRNVSAIPLPSYEGSNPTARLNSTIPDSPSVTIKIARSMNWVSLKPKAVYIGTILKSVWITSLVTVTVLVIGILQNSVELSAVVEA